MRLAVTCLSVIGELAVRDLGNGGGLRNVTADLVGVGGADDIGLEADVEGVAAIGRADDLAQTHAGLLC